MNRADELIERARQVLADTDVVPVSERPTGQSRYQNQGCPLNPLDRWKRDANAFAVDCAAAKEEMRAYERAQQREARETHSAEWCAHFERMLQEERATLLDSIGMALGQVRAELRQEFTEQIRDVLDRVERANVLPFGGKGAA